MCIWNAVFGVLMLELGICLAACAGVLPPCTLQKKIMHINAEILENNSAAVLNDFSFPSAYEVVW